MRTLLILIIAVSIISFLMPFILLWYKRNHCPKCGGWKCLKYVTEVVTDKVVGHDHNRYGSGGGYGRRFFGGMYSSHTSDQPFIRYWVEERYICQKCGRHISVHTRKDKR